MQVQAGKEDQFLEQKVLALPKFGPGWKLFQLGLSLPDGETVK